MPGARGWAGMRLAFPQHAFRKKRPPVALHRFQAEPETYGAAAFLMVVHMVRALAGRDAKAKRYWSQVLEHAAKDAAKLDNDFGKQTAALIRHVLIMNPLFDPGSKN